MKVLLIGSGAREHALGWALAHSPRVSELMSLPGNPGLEALGAVLEGVAPTDVGAVAAIARIHAVDLVVVGPEAPLAKGVVDAVSALGIPCFGPSRVAARLESSKSFAKGIMQRSGVPTAEACVFDDRTSAESHIKANPGPYVVKADGLAAGKGVLVTTERDRALAWVGRCFDGAFGDAGARVVVEEFLDGPELSVFAICDGTNATPLEPARDFKRLGDNDSGPNTGGMGSFSPVELSTGLIDDVMKRVIQPTLDQMAQEGTPYVGFLYAGLALTETGPKVIEFNCRLGDPETQVLIPRLRSDLVDLLEAAMSNGLERIDLEWSSDHAVDVVLAAAGYPDNPQSGDQIFYPREPGENVHIFHAGTGRDEKGRLLTNGGRVLNVVGLGADRVTARSRAYDTVHQIEWPGMQYRSDIAADAFV